MSKNTKMKLKMLGGIAFLVVMVLIAKYCGVETRCT